MLFLEACKKTKSDICSVIHDTALKTSAYTPGCLGSVKEKKIIF
jgi:hypothetical protein